MQILQHVHICIILALIVLTKKTGYKNPTDYQIIHNYIRQHKGLNGKTPAEVSGIRMEDKNKWIPLIQNAKK
jgi:hypothetical protein